MHINRARMNALDLAKYIITKCMEDGCPITNMQLQKIMYCIQKEYLKRGEKAFASRIEAWKFGPAIPDVYYHFCGFGSMPILMEYDDSIDENEKYVDPIVVRLRRLSPWDLVSITHKKNGAWDRIYDDGRGCRKTIPVDLIKFDS